LRRVPPPEDMARSLLENLQNDTCFMCTLRGKMRNPRRKAVSVEDHCHHTGMIRSLLCQTCNIEEGHAGPYERPWAVYRNFYPAKGWYYRYSSPFTTKTVRDLLVDRISQTKVIKLYNEDNRETEKAVWDGSFDDDEEEPDSAYIVDTYIKTLRDHKETRKPDSIDVKCLLNYSLSVYLIQFFSSDELTHDDLKADIVLFLDLTIQTDIALVERFITLAVYSKSDLEESLEIRIMRFALLALVVSYPLAFKLTTIDKDAMKLGKDCIGKSVKKIQKVLSQEWTQVEKDYQMPKESSQNISRLLSYLSNYGYKNNLMQNI